MKTKKRGNEEVATNGNRVTLRLDEEETPLMFAYWKSNGVPVPEKVDNLVIEVHKKKKDAKGHHSRLVLTDAESNVTFEGLDTVSEGSDYMIGEKRGNQLVLRPANIFHMRPQLVFAPTETKSLVAQMSKKEKLDELNDKFGSKKTKRMLEAKKKFAIQFDDQEVDIEKEMEAKPSLGTTLKGSNKQTLEVDDVPSVPPQNASAICVEEVYRLDDIVSFEERESLKVYDLKSSVDDLLLNGYVKELLGRNSSRSELDLLLALYVDHLVTLYNLGWDTLRRADPIPDHKMMEPKMIILKKYYAQTTAAKGKKWYITAKQKDRMAVHGLILGFMLTNYRPLEMDKFSAGFKIPGKQMKKIGTAVGCFFENKKNAEGLNSKYLVMKFPMNVVNERPLKKTRKF